MKKIAARASLISDERISERRCSGLLIALKIGRGSGRRGVRATVAAGQNSTPPGPGPTSPVTGEVEIVDIPKIQAYPFFTKDNAGTNPLRLGVVVADFNDFLVAQVQGPGSATSPYVPLAEGSWQFDGTGYFSGTAWASVGATNKVLADFTSAVTSPMVTTPPVLNDMGKTMFWN